ncbi:hypothetical protein PP353_gp37 [Arthrobacter phage Kumotta]|uniref:Helix-turn-helix DNA-binding domain protein n=1 Tax=Arthrobacter phage Kumotta TaxID=2588498 RepID=A0A4Y6ENF2_9CAUD|nr:hypothetical protein PP353_gp37 [Arthrobacter phage Kumotta]QDF19547.1 hypothetical protein SEA_KUMOTTA_37 [Arthrobacter phage Kumotta]
MKAAALEQDKESWLEDAVATIIALANSQVYVTADDLRREMREPDHPSWPGRAIVAAKKAGYIERVGYQPSRAKARRYGATALWTKKKAEARS